MIARDAEPIDHRPPYRRIDLGRRPLKPIITEEEYRAGVVFDEALYELDFVTGTWRLKS